jgi:hypothetical protein
MVIFSQYLKTKKKPLYFQGKTIFKAIGSIVAGKLVPTNETEGKTCAPLLEELIGETLGSDRVPYTYHGITS